jgi:hypothetical protein
VTLALGLVGLVAPGTGLAAAVVAVRPLVPTRRSSASARPPAAPHARSDGHTDALPARGHALARRAQRPVRAPRPHGIGPLGRLGRGGRRPTIRCRARRASPRTSPSRSGSGPRWPCRCASSRARPRTPRRCSSTRGRRGLEPDAAAGRPAGSGRGRAAQPRILSGPSGAPTRVLSRSGPVQYGPALRFVRSCTTPRDRTPTARASRRPSSGHPRLPRARQRLVGHRLQLPRRPVRQVFEGRAGGIEANVVGAQAGGFNNGSTAWR